MLDALDRALLDEMQRNNQQTHAVLGRRVGLSPSAVRRRLARLRAEGVIQADVSIVAPDPAAITVIVQVRYEKETLKSGQDFRRRMQDAPEVSQCYSVAGETDFILVVHAPNLAAYEAWGERTLMSDPLILRYDSHVVWSRVKFSTVLPTFG